ncbi:hypothetical protein HY640_04685 [Candidatus Woesearchaeota archaeon]|nr:hypothetical protein [Candidatus Woesearchaeota archaeon]
MIGDSFTRLAMIVVGVSVILMLLVFSYRLSGVTLGPQLRDEESVSGKAEIAVPFIIRMCSLCSSERYLNRDCSVLRLELYGSLQASAFPENIKLGADLSSGSHVLRVSNRNGFCELRGAGD